jgi:antitoxin (DNA-binding transcriptional repressor) of toxin-antitoxin stability system
MKKIRVTEFVRHFGDVLQEVTRGEEYAVTSRGRAVAYFGPSPSDLDVSSIEQSTIGLKPEKGPVEA